MKSSTGKYYIGLDHVRAVAAFIVFAWHFIVDTNGHLAPPPIFPLSILTEGHTGVAIFMALSGYLFANLLDDKKLNYYSFLWNRFVRLFPLLFFVIVLVGVKQYFNEQSLLEYSKLILLGAFKPTLPNGGWSITVEFHFYLILPVLLLLSAKSKYALWAALLLAIVLRYALHQQNGEVHSLSYWTIVGRFDQFVLGILAYNYSHYIKGKHLQIIVTLLLFLSFYWYFDSLGGFYQSPSYPSPSILWVFLPTLEGIAYSMLIAWYATSFNHSSGPISKFIALIGTCSYSIYLLHFFVVFSIAKYIDVNVISLSNIYLALLFSIIGFLIIFPMAFLSYQLIEKPFFRFRRTYITDVNK